MTKYTKERLWEMMNRVADMPLERNIDEILNGTKIGFISEAVDFENDFSDIEPTSCWNTEELKNYLNQILTNYNLPSSKRKKPELIIHNKLIKKDEKGEIDVQQFIDNIIKEPPNIITDGNSKMIKSATDDFYTVTIGLPAYRGLVVDINANPPQFFVVSTCPGASDKCKNVCYARKGRFVIQPNIFVKQTRILNLLMNNPKRFKEKLKSEIIKLYNSESKKGEREMRFRWNDSGDFFTKKYFQIANEVMNELKSDNFKVKPYAHTKVADIYNTNRGKFAINPEGLSVYQKPDFVISFSVDAADDQVAKVNLEGAKTSEIMFKDFQDLFKRDENGRIFLTDENGKLEFKDEVNGPKILKQRVSKNFGVPNDNTLLMHDEMMDTPEADVPTYNVIVQLKGETDISTMRPDVKRTFFMVH